MEEQAREGTNRRSVLDIGQRIEPVEKALNRLAERTDKGGKSVARNQRILFALFPWSKQFNSVFLFERSFPGGINVGFISIQASLLQMNMIFQNLLGGRQIVLSRTGSHEGEGKWQTPWPSGNHGMAFDSAIPFSALLRCFSTSLFQFLIRISNQIYNWERCEQDLFTPLFQPTPQRRNPFEPGGEMVKPARTLWTDGFIFQSVQYRLESNPEWYTTFPMSAW